MRHSLLTSACAALIVLATAGLASADSKHFQPTAVKATKKGCTVTFCAQSDGYNTHARVTIGDPSAGSWGPYTYRAGSVSKPYVKKVLPSQPVPRTPTEITFELDYEADGIKPGHTYDLTTVWNSAAAAEGAEPQHVWGMSRSGVTPVSFTTPELKPPAVKKAPAAKKTATEKAAE